MKQIATIVFIALLSSCSTNRPKQEPSKVQPAYYKVDPATASVVAGKVSFKGRKPQSPAIDMSEEPLCVEAHKKGRYDGPVVVDSTAGLANAFVCIKQGLEGKTFEPPSTPAVIDQHGCWFQPRVLGIQTGQTLQVANSDPVTHNIHPLAQINREWNHSQGQGDAPLARRFLKPEIMIRVKCNIHSWMRAYIGVVDHPYFAVTDGGGRFEIRNLPPGEYVLGAWHEAMGEQEARISVPPARRVEANFSFKGE
jgi:plastocyanin